MSLAVEPCSVVHTTCTHCSTDESSGGAPAATAAPPAAPFASNPRVRAAVGGTAAAAAAPAFRRRCQSARGRPRHIDVHRPKALLARRTALLLALLLHMQHMHIRQYHSNAQLRPETRGARPSFLLCCCPCGTNTSVNTTSPHSCDRKPKEGTKPNLQHRIGCAKVARPSFLLCCCTCTTNTSVDMDPPHSRGRKSKFGKLPASNWMRNIRMQQQQQQLDWALQNLHLHLQTSSARPTNVREHELKLPPLI